MQILQTWIWETINIETLKLELGTNGIKMKNVITLSQAVSERLRE